MKKLSFVLILLITFTLASCKVTSTASDNLSESEKQIFNALIIGIPNFFYSPEYSVEEIRSDNDEYCFTKITGKNNIGEVMTEKFILYLTDSEYEKGTMTAIATLYGEQSGNLWNSVESTALNENSIEKINTALYEYFK